MYRFEVPGMKCGGCREPVVRAIEGIDPQARIEVDLEARSIRVTSDKAETSLLSALREAGYSTHPLPSTR